MLKPIYSKISKILSYILVLSFFVSLSQNVSYASSYEGLGGYVDKLIDDSLEAMRDPKRESKKQKIKQIMSENLDLKWIAIHTLPVEKLSQEQIDICKKYILQYYTEILLNYNIKNIIITNLDALKPSSNKKTTNVNTIITKTDNNKIAVIFTIAEVSDSQFKIQNIQIEGLNLLINQKAEFRNLIQEKGIDGFIQSIKNLIK